MTLTGFMALIIVLPLTIGIFGGEWLFKTKEKIKMKRFTTKVLKSAGVLMLLASAAFGQIGFTSSGGISTETVQTLISDSLTAKFPYKVYRAALSQSGDGATTLTSGDLVVGQRYEITTLKGAGTTPEITAAGSGYTTSSPVSTTGGNGTGLTVSITADAGAVTDVVIVDGGLGYEDGDELTVDAGNTDCTFTIGIISDDFTNVGAAENTQGTIFRAIGTTPTSWTSESVLTDQSDPIATVMENTFDGTPEWTREGVGAYQATLADAFTEGKTFILLNGQVLNNGEEFAMASYGNVDAIQIDTYSVSQAGVWDGILISNSSFIQIIVYP